MAYQVQITNFRGTKKCLPLRTLMENPKKKFLKYTLMSNGLPLLLTIVTCIMQYIPKQKVENFIRPEIGIGKCWLAGMLFCLKGRTKVGWSRP